MNELALFAGAGGGILGGKLLGWRTVCAVEWEPYPASVLLARQNDGLLETFPIWDDVQTFDGKPWAGIVDVVSGGFPCQDISTAGKGAGLDGERSGMWKHMARVVGEVRPRFVFVENSPMLANRGLGRVVGDLSSMGYDAKWTVMGAADIGANHQRDRIWIVAKATNSSINRLPRQADKQIMEIQRRDELQLGKPRDSSEMVDTESCGGGRVSRELQTQDEQQKTERQKTRLRQLDNASQGFATSSLWWQIEPNVGRMVDGMDSGVDRLKAIGNGQVPLCAATAWQLLINEFEKETKCKPNK